MIPGCMKRVEIIAAREIQRSQGRKRLKETAFRGGLDTETPPWDARAGKLKAAENYEISLSGGYRDVAGYERYDGRPRPHLAPYYLLSLAEGDPTGTFEAVDPTDVDVGTSMATFSLLGKYVDGADITAIVVANDEVDVADTAAMIGLTVMVDGTDHTVEDAQQDGVADTKYNALMRHYAANVRRKNIGKIPGSAKILGLWWLGSTLFGVRDNAAGTEAVIHKATADGWERVPVGEAPFRALRFVDGSRDGHTEDPVMPDGVTLRVERGTWTAGTVAGVITYSSDQTLNADGAGSFDDANGRTFDITWAGNVFSLAPGGRFRTDRGDFGYGDRIYGCDGKNNGFAFDGESMLQIDTGNDEDAPEYVAVHVNHLFFAFKHSLQHSGIGNPFDWEAVAGAVELALPAPITALNVEPGESGNAALSVWLRQRIYILYGTSSADWNLVNLRREVGALPDTVQEIVQTAFFDDRGVRYLEAVQEFANFAHSTLTEHCQSLVNDILARADDNPPVGSCIVRQKNQYRLFFADGRALYLTFKGSRMIGVMPINLERKISTVHSSEDHEGFERIFFGTEDGVVYEMEKGTSFDGENIAAYLQLHADYLGKQWQGWRQAVLQCRGPSARRRLRGVQRRLLPARRSAHGAVGEQLLDGGQAGAQLLGHGDLERRPVGRGRRGTDAHHARRRGREHHLHLPQGQCLFRAADVQRYTHEILA